MMGMENDEKDTKREGYEKVEKVEKDTFSTKATNSTFSTKSTRYLTVKGMSLETSGTFRMLSGMLELKYSELIELLLATYFEQNPVVEDRLSGKPVHFKLMPKGEENKVHRNLIVDNKMKTFLEMERNGKLSSQARKFWMESIFQPFLTRKDVPQEQKIEIEQLFMEGGA